LAIDPETISARVLRTGSDPAKVSAKDWARESKPTLVSQPADLSHEDLGPKERSVITPFPTVSMEIVLIPREGSLSSTMLTLTLGSPSLQTHSIGGTAVTAELGALEAAEEFIVWVGLYW
jgi:hypothetical protein